MDLLIFASLSHTPYWYEVAMLKIGTMYRFEPRLASTVIIPHGGSHPIVELADHLCHLRWYSIDSEHLPEKCAVARVVCLLQVNEAQE